MTVPAVRRHARLAAVVSALALVATTPAVAAEPPVPALPGSCALPGIDDRCESFATVFNGAPQARMSSEAGTSVALSPDGRTAFATIAHRTGGREGATRWLILAVDTATGSKRWTARFEGSRDFDLPNALAVSRDGRRVFATGDTHVGAFEAMMLTIAYDAATGREVWRAVHDGPGDFDNGRALALSPDGRELYVAGSTRSIPGAGGDVDMVVAAYDTRRGAERWVRRWAGARTGRADYPVSIGVHPTGRLVYAAGQAAGTANAYDIDVAAIAVHVDGKRRGRVAWSQRWDLTGRGENDEGYDMAVDPAGRYVYVAGRSRGDGASSADFDAATVALDAVTGGRRWIARAHGPVEGYSSAQAIAASGGRVFVTAQMTGSGSREFDWRTIAYDGVTGGRLWDATMSTPDADGEYPSDIVATSGGIFVTGKSFFGHTNPLGRNGDIQGISDQVTAAYDPATGVRRWIARYNATGYDHATSEAIAAAGGRVVVLGRLSYKGDFTELTAGNPYGKENYVDLSITGYAASGIAKAR